MHPEPSRFISRMALLLAALSFSACAPQSPLTSEEAAPVEEAPAIRPLQMVTATPRPQPSLTPTPPKAARAVFDPENPDWELRYQELYARYADMFRAPTVGQSVSIELTNGSTRSGVLNNLTAHELSLDVGNGVVTYPLEGLTENSAANFFQSAYARNRALAQGRMEYQRWQQLQAAAQSTPTPTPPRTVREIADEAVNSGRENVPDYPSSLSGIPRNEGPTGRVAQVDEYIRKNAAVPHSLRIKAWGPVQPHLNGYKVRVQYTLESADGFGLSNEDMMFFMNANGRVYQKAPVK